jgi:hypothetical protein
MTSGSPRRGTNAQVVTYWREYPDRFATAWRQQHPRPRRSMAAELFPHLSSAPRTVEGTRLPTPGRVPAHQARPGASFFSAAEAARGATSPLGGVARVIPEE